MKLDHLESFLAVARASGFREASKQTGTAQPTLSQHIRKLEQDLGVALLRRQNNGCELTDAGRILTGYAESLLATARQARRALDQRSLTIGASSNIGVYLLPEKIAAFRRHCPDLDLDLTIDDNLTIAGKLARQEIDIALMEWWDARSGFTAVPWRRDELVLVVAPDHPWSQRQTIEADELEGLVLLGGESASGTGRLLQEKLGPLARTLQVKIQLGSTEAVKRAVQAGLGMSIVMLASVRDEIHQGSLCAVRIANTVLQKQLFMVRGNHWPAHSAPVRLMQFLAGQQ